MHNLYVEGIAKPPTDKACDRDQHQMLNPLDSTVALTCGACESHNVSDKTGLGVCGDCGLTDNLSAFTGGGLTSNARFQPSQYAKGGGSARSFDAPRGWTISGSVD